MNDPRISNACGCGRVLGPLAKDGKCMYCQAANESKLPFYIGQRVEFDSPVSGKPIRAVVVNLHGEHDGTGEPGWACANVESYGTCIMAESLLRASDWRFPWETEQPKDAATVIIQDAQTPYARVSHYGKHCEPCTQQGYPSSLCEYGLKQAEGRVFDNDEDMFKALNEHRDRTRDILGRTCDEEPPCDCRCSRYMGANEEP